MTFQGFILLHKMKKTQRTPNDWLSVDLFTDTIETANTNLNDRKTVYLRSRFWQKHLKSTLEDLSASGYITLGSCTLSGESDYQITAKGQYIFQHGLGSFFQFLMKSIVTPIIVSILTTYVTLKIFGEI